MLDARYYYIFLVVPYISEGVYLFGCFLLYFLFSLSLLFSLLTGGSLHASASETNRVGFTEFSLQK